MRRISARSGFICTTLILPFCLTLLTKWSVTQTACSCCLRVEKPCECQNVRFGHFPPNCGNPIPNLTNLIKKPYIHVEEASLIPEGLYTVIALDTEAFYGSDRWHKAYLVIASWNIEHQCLVRTDGCKLINYLPIKTADCLDDYDRFDPLRIILLHQTEKISSQFWAVHEKTRQLSYAELYNRALFRLPPVRMSEYQIRYCAHHVKYDKYLLTKYITTTESGCMFDQPNQRYLRNLLLDQFPKLFITQSQVDQELGDCYIRDDWIKKAKRARSESSQRNRACPFNMIKYVREMNVSEQRAEFVQHILKRTNQWFWLTSVEYMHLTGIKHSSDVYTNYQPGFDVHAAFCGSFVRQKKKTEFCATRTEAFRQILLELGIFWKPET